MQNNLNLFTTDWWLGSNFSCPLLLWGPPGTGKTIVLAFTIFKYFSLYPNKQILVTWPSNSWADNILEKLAWIEFIREAGIMIRLNSASRQREIFNWLFDVQMKNDEVLIEKRSSWKISKPVIEHSVIKSTKSNNTNYLNYNKDSQGNPLEITWRTRIIITTCDSASTL